MDVPRLRGKSMQVLETMMREVRTMDPNEVLAKLRRLVAEYNMTHDIHDEQRELVDAAVDLDEWLSGGGFLPDAWQRQDAYNAGQQAEATARYNAGQIGDDKPMSE
jgi:hypothetical protein